MNGSGGLRNMMRYARTVRHLRPRQIAGRLRRVLPCRPPVLSEHVPVMDADALDRIRVYLSRRANALGPGETAPPTHATFLCESAPLDYGAPWLDTVRPMLWRYHLHAFRHLDGLLRPDASHPSAFLDAVHDWLGANPPVCRPAWDPYPLSGRLLRWVAAEACHRFNDDAMLRAMGQQAAFLRANLEYDVDANHLLKNAAALCVYGAVADVALRDFGLALLRRECAAQILADGMHYERSPMYHALLLEDLLLVHAALAEPPDALTDCLERMTHALEVLCHPDGELPLFGDTALEEAMPAQALLELARGHLALEAPPPEGASIALEDAGFYVLRPRDTGHHLIVKAGPPGPAHQLGHAHSDPVTFELSVDGQRIIVDSGVHGYAESPLRDYCRSVAAHNTVCVNGHEPLECWDTFRVARRYRFKKVLWPPDALSLTAVFRVYQGCRINRVISWEAAGGWRILDEVPRPGDINAESYIHFHPECEVAAAPDGESWIVRRGGVALEIRPIGADSVRLVRGQEDPRQGWYCPRFGEALPAPVLILSRAGRDCLELGYTIVPVRK